MKLRSKNEINESIIDFWNNYLNFWELPSKWITKVISHNTGDESQNIPPSYLPENEFFIFEHRDKWRVISVHEKYTKIIADIINSDWYNIGKLTETYEKLTHNKPIIKWPVFSYYLYSTENLLPRNENVKKLEIGDVALYNEFIKSCINEEIKEVDMQFEDPAHNFYVLYQNWDKVSVCNYSTDEKNIIWHIWIITPRRFQWNWYAKILVNTVILEILENNLIPQYRAGSDNPASIKIAESLWFKKVIESFSIIP